MEVFYINICGFIRRNKLYYETRVLDNVRFKVQLPIYDSTEITAGGPKITVGGPALPGRLLAETFCTQSEYFTISNSVFTFNFLARVVSEILGGPKFTLGALRSPLEALPPKNLYPKRVLYHI